MDANRIFRKAALDRMSSPEQLDQLLQVTAPRTWLALTALVLCLGTALAWGYWGRVTTTVEASGMLVASGGVRSIPSPLAGQISDLRVRIGDRVAAGQVMAIVGTPQLLDRLQAVRGDPKELALLGQQLDSLGQVVSPYTGRVDHIAVSVGATVPAGSPIVTLRPENDRPEAVLYLEPARAQQVRRGMSVTIRVGAGEDAYVLPARVELVATAPTADTTQRGAGSLIAVYVVVTGNVTLPAQTVPCHAEIVIREQRPLSLVVPGLDAPPSR